MNDIFVKQLTNTLFYTTLITFLNLYKIVRMTYNLEHIEYFLATDSFTSKVQLDIKYQHIS